MRTLDTVWMIAKVEDPGRGVIYARPGLTETEAWKNALRATRDITGSNQKYWKRRGYEATQVEIICDDPE